VSAIVRAAATGDITTQDCELRGVTLTAGSDAATVVLREGGSSGTVRLTVKAAANTTVAVPLWDASIGNGLHATFTGTGPEASFVLN
jgi:hypothetical protein